MSENNRIKAMSDLVKESKLKRERYSFNLNTEEYKEPSIKAKEEIPQLVREDFLPKAKKGRPFLSREEKRKKYIVYLTDNEAKRIKTLYKGKTLGKISTSIKKGLNQLYRLKEREQKQMRLISKLISRAQGELDEINKTLALEGKNLTDNKKKDLTKNLDRTSRTIQEYLHYFQITNIDEVRDHFSEQDFRDLRFICSRSIER